MTFAKLGLSQPILDAIADQGYTSPSPIQAAAITPVLDGRDVMAAAQTGTGKTAAFTLPIIERLSRGQPAKANQARALILTPTRELAAQVGDNVAAYSKNLNLKSTIVFGGVKINPQMMRLRRGVDVLIATPGRLLDLYQQNAVRFDQLEVLVLDEADRMLDMGFIHDIRKVMAVLPKKRQTLMFSATFSKDIRALAKTLVHNPVEVSVSPPNSTAEKIIQRVHPVDKRNKSALLIKLITDNSWHQVLIFTRTKHGANKLTRQLDSAGISAAAIHGNKSQGARTKALAGFKQGSVQALVATDIAARGIDISQLPQVVNYDLPNIAEDYVHRIGRTARAGANGAAVSLVSADEVDHLANIERLIQQLLPREEIEEFEPEHRVPETQLDSRPVKISNTGQQRAKSGDRQGRNQSNRGAKSPRAGNTAGPGQSRRNSNGNGNGNSRNANRNNGNTGAANSRRSRKRPNNPGHSENPRNANSRSRNTRANTNANRGQNNPRREVNGNVAPRQKPEREINGNR